MENLESRVFIRDNRKKILALAHIGIGIARDGISSDYTRQEFFEMIPKEFQNLEIQLEGSEGYYWIKLIKLDSLGNASANEVRITGIRSAISKGFFF